MAQSIKKVRIFYHMIKMFFLRAKKKLYAKKSYKYKNCFRIYKYIINYYYCKYLFYIKKIRQE